MRLIYDGLGEGMIKILMATSILSMIVEWVYESLNDGGWISGVSFMTTCILIVVLSSLSSYNCQSKLIKLEEEANEQFVSVFRNSNESFTIKQRHILVGDIYRI